MAEQNRRLTRSEVIVSTSRAYASVIRAREMRQVAERYHALLTELLRSVESARKHGLKPQNDVLKVRVKLNESELNLRRTENALRLATMNLCHLIGRPLTDRIEVADDLPDLPSTPVPAADLMARPEYRLLDRKAELAREQLRLARSERLPQVGLVGNYGYLHGVELNGQNLLGGWAFTARRAGVGADLPLRRPLEQGTVGTGAVRAGAGRSVSTAASCCNSKRRRRRTTSTKRSSKSGWPSRRSPRPTRTCG